MNFLCVVLTVQMYRVYICDTICSGWEKGVLILLEIYALKIVIPTNIYLYIYLTAQIFSCKARICSR